IYANSQLGIDWNDDGVTANNSGVVPNYPVLTFAKSKTRRIKGTITATPGHDVLIEYFSNPKCDPSGYGEGKKFIGAKEVLLNAMGNKKISFVSPKKLKKGSYITATMMDQDGSTSEFSACVKVA